MLANESHWKHIAAMATEHDAHGLAAEPDNAEIVPPGTQIESQPQHLYVPAAWLRTAGSPKEHSDLAALLGDLWQFSEDYVGFGTREAEAYLHGTQQNRPLIDSLRQWCETYFLKRVQKPNPKDHNNPLLTLDRLVKEYHEILGRLYYYHNSINRAFLGECGRYVSWFLCWWLDSGTFASPAIDRIPFVPPMREPRTDIQKLLNELALFYDTLGTTLVKVSQAADDKLQQFSAMNDEEILARLQQLYEDIRHMQPFLCNVSPDKTITTLPRAVINRGTSHPIIAGWQWCVQGGIALIVVDWRMESIQKNLEMGHLKLGVRVTDEGVFHDYLKPWITTKNEFRIDVVNLLAVNLYLLELFHEKLFGFYDQIDFDRMRQGTADDASEEATDEKLALSCQDLAEREDTPDKVLQYSETVRTHRLRPLRSDVLLRWLEKHFSCEVKAGKGSEITVYREGGKKGIVRGHGQSETVHVITLKNLLKKLGISTQEWMRTVYA